MGRHKEAAWLVTRPLAMSKQSVMPLVVTVHRCNAGILPAAAQASPPQELAGRMPPPQRARRLRYNSQSRVMSPWRIPLVTEERRLQFR